MILKLAKNTLLSCMLITMVACGGGSGDEAADTGVSYDGNTSQATLTDANAGQIAGSALSNGGEGGSLSLSVTGTGETNNGPSTSHSLIVAKTVKDIVAHLEANPETISTVNSLAVTTLTDTILGDCGGQATFTFSGNSTGDFGGSMSFSSFCNGGETINGTVIISGQADSNNQIISLKMTFIRLTFKNGTESATATGSVTVTTATNTVTVEMRMRNHATNKTYWVKDYTITSIDNIASGYEEVTITSGRFFDFDHGYVDIVTTSPLLTYFGDDYPFSGSLTITGQNGSAILTALSNTNFQLEIHINGNVGVITLTGLWTDL